MINRHVVSIPFFDPGQDSRLPLLKVPEDHVYTVEKAYATVDRATAASETDFFSLALQNGGTDQAETDAISDEIGGTGGWEANTVKNFAITAGAGDLTAGQWLMLNYDETAGTAVDPGLITVTIEYVDGIGSKA